MSQPPTPAVYWHKKLREKVLYEITQSPQPIKKHKEQTSEVQTYAAGGILLIKYFTSVHACSLLTSGNSLQYSDVTLSSKVHLLMI